MQITVGAVDVALSLDGNALGYVQVSDSSPFYPGATCQVYTAAGSGVTPVQVVITDLLSDGKSIGCRIIPTSPLTGTSLGTGPKYGRSDMSAFTTARGSRICQDRQGVAVNPSFATEPLL